MEEIFVNNHYQFPWDSLGKPYLVSEENAELIKSFNETLQSPYPVPINNHVNPYGLVFWTKEDFYFLKNLVTAFPSVMYTLPIIPAAENYADPYCYNTELRKIAIKASFKAQARVSEMSSEPLPYPSIVNRQLVQGSNGDCGIPVANYFEGPFFPPSGLTAYRSFAGSNGLYHHQDDTFSYNFQMVHTHDCIHHNATANHHHHHVPPPREDFMISSLPTSTTCTPPKLSDEEILGTSLTNSLEEDVEAEAIELGEDESDNQGKSSDVKDLYGVHIKLSADSKYSTMAGIPHKEYSKYMYGENNLHDGVISGFEDLLSKYELNESQTSLVKNGDLSDDQQSASTVSLKPRKIFLHGKFDFPSFSKDDCADSRSTKSRSRVRRTGSQGRQSLSPSPENTIKRFLLLNPFNGNVECVFCKGNSQTEDVYRSHPIRDKAGVVVCPYLRKYVCLICNATGDAAHTIKYCPFNKRGFFAMRENFPPFNNVNSSSSNSNNSYHSAPECDKEIETSSESIEEYVTVSPASSTPNSGSSSTLSQKSDYPCSSKLKEFKPKAADFCANDILKEHRCLNIPSHAKLIENSTFGSSSSNCKVKSSISTSKSSCTMHLSTPVVSTSSGSAGSGNGPFYKRMEKERKSARKLWTSGRSS